MNDWFTEKALYIFAQVSNPTKADLGLPDVAADQSFAQKIFAIVFGLAGAIAVLIIVIASLNIAKSSGNPEEIAKGKRTIIYALVGLAVALSAEIIVAFVLGRL